MDFFGSLAKTEQKVLSKIVMTYAGPSQLDLAIGCLASTLRRNAKINDSVDEDEDFDEYGNTMLQSCWFQRNGRMYYLRAQEMVIGTIENDDGVLDRFVLKVEVQKHCAHGSRTWEVVPSVHFVEIPDDTPIVAGDGAGKPIGELQSAEAYWSMAQMLLPKLEAMIKCASCGMDIINRTKIIQLSGDSFLSNHCLTCTQRTWATPCTKCGSHLGDREFKQGPPGADFSYLAGNIRPREDHCFNCK